jgi:structural maintenance of chromosome 1
MDAISFVLGIKSSHLRSTQLRDLIYRGRVIRTTKINADGTATDANGDGETQENGSTQTSSQRNDPQSAWVMAVFEDDAEQVHKWKRTITSAGQSEYRIDGRVVTQKAYNDALEEQSILIKARNFLVFQGDVESVASQNPKELTRLIEQISGSLEYRADYERLKEEAEKASEAQTTQLTSRRQINAEIKTYQEQKAEADEYEKKVTERDEAIVTHVLWKLYHFQRTIEDSSNKIAQHQDELKEHKRVVEKYHQKLDDAKQAHAKVSRDVNKLEKNIKNKEKEIEDAENDLVPIDEKIKISRKDLDTYESRISKLNKDQTMQTQLIDRHKKDLATVQKAQQKWEDEFQASAQQQGRHLSKQDQEEYTRLRGDVTKRTHENQIEINRLQREVNTDKDTVENLKQKVKDLQEQVQKFEDDIAQLQSQQQEAKARGKELEKERAAKLQQYNQLVSDRKQTESQKQELNELLQESYRKLNEAEGGRRQNDRERNAREAVSRMKGIFQNGVYGRYSDVCRPKMKKYETAVSTLLGWQMDAIIVDKEETAKACIQYLKEQKIGQFNFVPLDTITIKAVNQNLKGMHPGMRLGIDCIDYEPHLERAMAAACGNSIICDDLKIAKYLCYEKRVDAKAVTLDGTVIAKGGTMTGGRLGSDKNSQRWNDSAVDNLNRVIEKQKAQLAALPKLDRRSQEEENLQVDLADLDNRIRRIQDELKTFDRNIADKKKTLQHYKQQLRELQPKAAEKSQRLQNHEEKLKGYQHAVDQVADQVFGAFCQRLGLASIRDYESRHGAVAQEAADKRVEFTKQRSKLENVLSFYQKNFDDLNERVQSLQEKAQRDEANMEGFEAEKEELAGKVDILNAELEQFSEQLSAVREKLSDRAAKVSDARKELDKQNESVKGVMKAVDDEEATIKRTAAKRYAELKKCRMEEIQIPLAKGSASLNSLPLGDSGRPDADAMDVDEDVDATQIQQPEVDDYGIEINFENLDPEIRDVSTTKAFYHYVLTPTSRSNKTTSTSLAIRVSKTQSTRSTARSTNRTPTCAPATDSKRPKRNSKKQRKNGKRHANLRQKRARTSRTSSRGAPTCSKRRSTTYPRTSKGHIATSPRVRSSRLADRRILTWKTARSPTLLV